MSSSATQCLCTEHVLAEMTATHRPYILDFLSLRQAHQSFDNTVCENASNKIDRLGRWVAGWWLHLVRGRNAFLLEFLPALGMVYLCSLSSKYFLQFLVCLCAEATWWFFPLDLALYISFLPQCFSAPAAWGGHWGPLSIYKFIVYHFQGIKIYRATPEKWETELKDKYLSFSSAVKTAQ